MALYFGPQRLKLIALCAATECWFTKLQTAVSGVILKYFVKLGDRVLQGQVLFELDSIEARIRY